MDIIRYPNPLLDKVSEPVIETDLALIVSQKTQMIQAMVNAQGVGLAAVQVGILKRYCLVKDHSGNTFLVINPEIIEIDTEYEKQREGCLSLPLFYEEIERPLSVTVKFRDEEWREVTGIFSGLEARCILHEIDHMNGQPIHNRVSPMKLQMWRKKLKKRGAL